MTNLLKSIKKYYEETTDEEILENWEKTKEWDTVGPTVKDWLNQINKNETPKFLVRIKDSKVFEIDESNNCYRPLEKNPKENQPNAMKHFTFENLTQNYGFLPIDESEIEKYENKNSEYIEFLCWQCRNDGHGEAKGGTYNEFLEYKKMIKKFKETNSSLKTDN